MFLFSLFITAKWWHWNFLRQNKPNHSFSFNIGSSLISSSFSKIFLWFIPCSKATAGCSTKSKRSSGNVPKFSYTVLVLIMGWICRRPSFLCEVQIQNLQLAQFTHSTRVLTFFFHHFAWEGFKCLHSSFSSFSKALYVSSSSSFSSIVWVSSFSFQLYIVSLAPSLSPRKLANVFFSRKVQIVFPKTRFCCWFFLLSYYFIPTFEN